MLRVRLSGGLALDLDGRELALPRSRRGRSLLAWLAAHPGRHPRGTVAALFWPDVLDESARSSLRAALSELRRALGDAAGCLVATREAVGLDGPGLEVDLRLFETRLASGDAEGAVAACRAPLLPDLDEDWVHAVRARHAAALARALDTLATTAERAGDAAQAVVLRREVAALDPLDEERHRRLMACLAAAGDPAAALRTADELAARLRDALGMAPSAATRTLAAEIRAAVAPAGPATPMRPAPAEVPRPPAVARAAAGPFVGRGPELARLAAVLDEAALTRARRLVLVTGEPGIGKSRLALRFAAELDTRIPVLVGRCSAEPLRAYEPFAELLGHLDRALGPAAVADLAGPQAAELDRLRDGPAVDTPATDAGARHRLFDAVDTLLASLGGSSPLVLLVDDIHWADRGTLLLLGTLLRSARAAPLVVLATCRDGEAGPGTAVGTAFAELRRDGAVERLPLGGLDEAAVTALAAEWLGPEDAARRGPAICARSAGNAFFAGELARAAVTAEPGGEGVPEGVREVIGGRRARLTPAADTLLVTAAVMGFRAELPPLVAAAGLGEREAEDAADELVAARLLREADDALALEFPHALVRDAVYADLGALRRAHLHRDAASALAATGAVRHVEQIAHHLSHGPEPVAAVPSLELAADRAMAAAAYEQAAGLRARAVAILDAAHADGDPRVGPLLAGAGEALMHAGDPAAAALRLNQAADVARRTGDATLLARAAVARCGLGVEIGHVDGERVALLEEALAAVADTDAALSSVLLSRLAIELYYAPSRDRSERLAADAVVAAERSGDPRTTAIALGARHVALWRADRLTERLELADAMIEAATVAGDDALRLQGHNWRAVDRFEAGDLDGWRAEAAAHGALAARLRLPSFTWYTPLWGAVDALLGGHYDEVGPLREQALAEGRRAGDSNAELFAEMLRYHERFLRDDWDDLPWAWVEDRIATHPAGFAYRPGYAWGLAALGREDEARAQLDIVLADDVAGLPFDTNWISAFGEIGECALLIGHADAARAVLRHLPPYATQQLAAGRAVITYGCGHRQLGHACAILGRAEEAAAHYEEAIRIDGRAGLVTMTERARAALDRLRATPAR